jgi:hypothetical protein
MPLTLEAARDAGHAGRCVIHNRIFNTHTTIGESFNIDAKRFRVKVSVVISCDLCMMQWRDLPLVPDSEEMEYAESFFESNPSSKALWLSGIESNIRRRAMIKYNVDRVEAQDE